MRVLATAIASAPYKPKTYVHAASLAVYRDRGDEILPDDAAPGTGLSPDVCLRWEREVADAEMGETAESVLRIGFVLGAGGDALGPLMRITRVYLGGTVGSGKQYSRLHASDLDAKFLATIDGRIAGTLNACSPAPVPTPSS